MTGYLPDFDDHESHRKRKYEKLPRDFIDFRSRRHYPPRCTNVFEALLWLSRGRPVFSVGIAAIVARANMSKRTVQRGLDDLHRDGWIERRLRRVPGGSLNFHSEYTLPHLADGMIYQ
jgi:ribosomal protein L34E